MRKPSFQIPRLLVDGIDPKWHKDIFRFVDSGDASPEFLDYLDQNIACQDVVEIAFTLVTQDVAATARQLKQSVALGHPTAHESMTTTYARLFTHLLLALSSLDEEQRDEVLSRVRGALPQEQLHRVMETVITRIDAGDDTASLC